MNLLTSFRLMLASLVFLSLTSLATADGPRKHQAPRKSTTTRSVAGRTETVNKNESVTLRKRQDKATPVKQPAPQGTTSPSNLKPPTTTKPTSGIIAILIGL